MRIGDACTLAPCSAAPQAGANVVCDLAADCPGLVCVSLDGSDAFCSADCDPEASGTCPRDLDGRPGVCVAVQETVGPGEPSNCTVGGNAARCTCVRCDDVSPSRCD